MGMGMGVSLREAYTSSKRTLDQITQDKYDNGDRAEAWTGDANNVYLAANYTRTYDMTYMGDTLDSLLLIYSIVISGRFWRPFLLTILLRFPEYAFCYCHLSVPFLNDKRDSWGWMFET
ncbi:hypothetical protein SARI_01465 [Salmonella enterica subsp. arizonae serovar 62:z4,z23:-]|uniref:Uncharacterized protein n=2 Tax=Salmonella enterica subsp. arizonae TaxID=59203 RepID=A9MRQ8_SALAR|nr:hypothetical protein SARI_01465 [Salmonella enterica subsp. arizonae serovar 62:z4,z23:-]